MSSSPLYNEKFRRPVVAFTELLRKGSGGIFREVGQYSAFMFRALVLAVDVEGGKLETPDATVHRRGEKDWEPGGTVLHQRVVGTDGKTPIAEYDIAPTSGPVNPANSVRARIIGSNIDQFTGDDDLRCYWPMFPGLASPSPGELVYVVFEDEEYTHGLWLAKVPTNNANQTANQVMLSQLGQAIQSGAAQAFKDTNTSSSNADGSPRRDYSQRLTNLFIK